MGRWLYSCALSALIIRLGRPFSKAEASKAEAAKAKALAQAAKFCTDDIPQLKLYQSMGYFQNIPPIHADDLALCLEAWLQDPALDRWGSIGGRLFVTCFSTWMLEVYYRHLPLYGEVPSGP